MMCSTLEGEISDFTLSIVEFLASCWLLHHSLSPAAETWAFSPHQTLSSTEIFAGRRCPSLAELTLAFPGLP